MTNPTVARITDYAVALRQFREIAYVYLEARLVEFPMLHIYLHNSGAEYTTRLQMLAGRGISSTNSLDMVRQWADEALAPLGLQLHGPYAMEELGMLLDQEMWYFVVKHAIIT